ncbi:putative peptidyl-prolyl cis-trans isomerase [Thioalkalivibrio sp. K90mix]|jgi:FKBP-type peptidyl-prolyl cis-trans isomerase SlyD|uniref:FKBP-type peptidyl-prolyl cis-trans isomerase n=1 Tax=unclassified Thioalkalivibrio TaxID=2621013 RepID=UPI000195A807|nr:MULTISPECIES: peptidyl-prolyl cis-trans isomerase [unclassified Thioalkalivibrio]ADC70584.1 putative peptidyl-prolyl cis-trans isomerase [Thioalkalivibrio sp. K90mix]
MTDVIKDNKYVELNYQVIDEKSGQVLTEVEFPLGYVHGVNEVLSPKVMGELEGKAQGETIEVPIDCNALYGPRDESLVITEAIENVPEEYRKLGTAILMENDRGQTKSFLVTRLDDKTITIDGNNPLCGRQVIFKLNVLLVRDATADEIEHGGKVESGPEIDSGRAVPIE